MKYFMLSVGTCVGIYIGLISLASADVAQKISTPAMEDDVAAVKVKAWHLSMREEAQICPKPQSAYVYAQEPTKLQVDEQAQLRTDLSDAFVQRMGWTCITPAERCKLTDPLPINSSCCCRSACGYVGP